MATKIAEHAGETLPPVLVRALSVLEASMLTATKPFAAKASRTEACVPFVWLKACR